MGDQRRLAGFPGAAHVHAKRRVIDLYVSSTQKTFQVKAYRLGNYAGLGQRLVWSSPMTPLVAQAPATVDPATRTTSCNWKISLKLDTSTWPEGFYYLVLSAPSPWFSRTPAPRAHMIPLVVESASLAGKAVLVFNDLTMQAYNKWGGASLYTGRDGKVPSRSLKVSFDRPYANPDVFETYNAPMIRTAESITDSRVALGYTTEARLAGNPALLTAAAAVLFSGHSEYWTHGMRHSVESARDAGTNVAFFGANNVYWRTRTEPSALGPDRLVVCYREAALDPLASAHPELATTRWRDAPYPEPECSLTGSMYGDLRVTGTFTVTEPSFFAFQGTGVKRGATFRAWSRERPTPTPTARPSPATSWSSRTHPRPVLTGRRTGVTAPYTRPAPGRQSSTWPQQTGWRPSMTPPSRPVHALSPPRSLATSSPQPPRGPSHGATGGRPSKP